VPYVENRREDVLFLSLRGVEGEYPPLLMFKVCVQFLQITSLHISTWHLSTHLWEYSLWRNLYMRLVGEYCLHSKQQEMLG